MNSKIIKMPQRGWLFLCVIGLSLGLSACATPPAKNSAAEAIRKEMDASAESRSDQLSDKVVRDALLPPLAVTLGQVDGKVAEAKFDISVNNTPAHQVFTALVSGTRYSILVHQEVVGNISLNLKDVTVFEALEVIRELYGYDYKVDATRIFILPITLQTRLFQVNYLTGQRDGKSSVRVTSGSVSDSVPSIPGSAAAPAMTSRGQDGSQVSMSSSTDFWNELSRALVAIVGNEAGRSVVISPMSGVIVIRAMPEELKNVATYLRASQISIERQVILEAKIIEVTLSDNFQSGVNWAGFGNARGGAARHAAGGVLSPGATLQPNAPGGAAQAISNATLSALPGSALATIPNAAGTLFGLAFQTNNFAALLNFLESQGNVHVLSSPRIATLNNQKAVLKVGTDEFFVTNVSSATTTTSGAATTTPTITLQPFFSGIALDVTPRIDHNNEIILHVHPAVSLVTTVNKIVDIGGTSGVLNLPLASSSISETDSIVRAHDGQIVAIGGLMRQATFDEQSGLPGVSKRFFGQSSKRTEKRELVILIKPTIVNSDRDWADDITRSRDRISGIARSPGYNP